ncbi:MAG: hydantoinase/oxoprolinase family protein, partial [Alphaproteobacteria bacterium]|nr:hydantoinase/oxoprolinase family protein [Alphaproteobacteria bacterium]
GRLSPGGLLGGAMALDAEAAHRVIAPVAERLGQTPEWTAVGVLGIVVASMVRAIRAISVERGHDPRTFALMALGGAGPLHVTEVARALGIGEVIVPPSPGILCAQGLVVSDLKEDFVSSGRYPVDPEGLAAAADAAGTLAAEAARWAMGGAAQALSHQLSLSFDMRYAGQNFELPVPVGETDGIGTPPAVPDTAALRGLFFGVHERSYGFHNPEDPMEIINIRLTAHGRLPKPQQPMEDSGEPPAPTPDHHRPVWFDASTAVETPVFGRSALRPGQRIEGPAIIEQLDTTTVVFPGDAATVDGRRNLILRVGVAS